MSGGSSLGRLTAVFLRIGNITFGGGDPTMAALYRELVEKRGWLGPRQYGLAYALARATPGTNLLAFCAGAAWYIRGALAAVLAVAAVTLPSAAVVLGLTFAYDRVAAGPAAAQLIGGVLAAAVGMMLAAAGQLVRGGFARRRRLRTSVLFGAACVLLIFNLLDPLTVLALAAATGLLWREPS